MARRVKAEQCDDADSHNWMQGNVSIGSVSVVSALDWPTSPLCRALCEHSIRRLVLSKFQPEF